MALDAYHMRVLASPSKNISPSPSKQSSASSRSSTAIYSSPSLRKKPKSSSLSRTKSIKPPNMKSTTMADLADESLGQLSRSVTRPTLPLHAMSSNTSSVSDRVSDLNKASHYWSGTTATSTRSRHLAESSPPLLSAPPVRFYSPETYSGNSPPLSTFISWTTSSTEQSGDIGGLGPRPLLRTSRSTPIPREFVFLPNSKPPSRSGSRPHSPLRYPPIERSLDGDTKSREGSGDGQVGLGIEMKAKGRKTSVKKSSAESDCSLTAKPASPVTGSIKKPKEEDFDMILRTLKEEGEVPQTFKREPLPEEYINVDPDEIISEQLDENYRGQAESFSKVSSRSTSMRSAASSHAGSPFPRSFSRKPPSRSATTSYETPSRPGKNDFESFASTQRSASASVGNSLRRAATDNNINSHSEHRTPSGRIIVEPYHETSGLSPASPHTTYGHCVYQLPTTTINSPTINITKRQQRNDPFPRGERGLFYFTEDENLAIEEEVNTQQYSCGKHEHCTDCRETEYSFLLNKAMPTSMPPEDRQKVINNNRSLRNIKNELENLAENGAIADDVFDQIMSILPSESSLASSSRGANANAAPSPAPTAAFNNMRIADPAPPAYSTPTPPSLPTRQQTQPSKPEIARAHALYRYAEPDDCNFEVGDEIVVYEYMNADWWLGKNVRTGKEGVFPVTYVQVKRDAPPGSFYGDEKNNGYPGMQQQQQQQGPPPPGPSNPYNSAVPPMQIAEQPSEQKPGKGGEMGKKFGKKLGNAAIFGAGATIGGNIVNSIF